MSAKGKGGRGKRSKLPDLEIPLPSDSDDESEDLGDGVGVDEGAHAQFTKILAKLKAGTEKENVHMSPGGKGGRDSSDSGGSSARKKSPSTEAVVDVSMRNFYQDVKTHASVFRADTGDTSRVLSHIQDLLGQLTILKQQIDMHKTELVGDIQRYNDRIGQVERQLTALEGVADEKFNTDCQERVAREKATIERQLHSKLEELEKRIIKIDGAKSYNQKLFSVLASALTD